ncbi:MAG: HD domain-containing protein [Proteobacteria bacterium]|nr:HD domain-containing protein [Pseudomonadota bacterium]
MKLHPVLGAEIVKRLPGSSRFVSGIKYHHERWDGTGYPDGLKGEDIPFFGRIVGICDVFDAMVSGRAYSGFIDQSDASYCFFTVL